MTTKILPLLFASLVLSACTITISPADVSVTGRVSFGIDLNDVIQIFEPTRGQGANYSIGESISFRVRTTQAGYLTLTSYNPDGSVDTFARNIFVPANQTTILSGPDNRTIWTLVPPRGFHRVRASFTPSPTDTARVTYTGVRGEDRWTQTISTEIRIFNIRDVRETSFMLN